MIHICYNVNYHLYFDNLNLITLGFLFISYSGNPSVISLAYETFTSPGVVAQDGANGYQNLFDAMVM